MITVELIRWTHTVFIDSRNIYKINVSVPIQIGVEWQQTVWLGWGVKKLTVDILWFMFKKLYTCLQFGDEKAGLIFLTLNENWLKLFASRISTKTA